MHGGLTVLVVRTCSSVTPEMLNWMLPAEKRRPFSKGKDKPWKYFVNANHPDVVELALVSTASNFDATTNIERWRACLTHGGLLDVTIRTSTSCAFSSRRRAASALAASPV